MKERKKFSLLKDFKAFIAKGNVIDMAIGVIIGTAFGAVVSSLVKDIFMPAIGALIGDSNFADLKVVLVDATADKAEVAIMYGNFISTLIDFLIIAFVLFVIIRVYSKLKRKEEKVEAPKPVDEKVLLLQEIRDLLKTDKADEIIEEKPVQE